jgi:Short C-terminal domain
MFRAGIARRMVRRRAIIGTAAVGGVAYAAGHHVATKSAEQQNTDAQQNAQIADLQQQPFYQRPAPPVAYAPTPSGGGESDVLVQLKQLGALRDSKVLTEAEFETAKKKILGEI